MDLEEVFGMFAGIAIMACAGAGAYYLTGSLPLAALSAVFAIPALIGILLFLNRLRWGRWL
jgi:hypothetical protein